MVMEEGMMPKLLQSLVSRSVSMFYCALPIMPFVNAQIAHLCRLLQIGDYLSVAIM
jgi:hypothetical protein